MSRRFVRRGESVLLSLSSAERSVLAEWVPTRLRDVYGADDAGDAARNRLFPVAYLDPTEEDAESEWRALVHPDLMRTRLDALARVEGAVARAETTRRDELVVELEPDDVTALLGVLNDSRLALGTVLEIDDDTELDPGAPADEQELLYLWLTQLEGELVDVLLDEMPG